MLWTVKIGKEGPAPVAPRRMGANPVEEEVEEVEEHYWVVVGRGFEPCTYS